VRLFLWGGKMKKLVFVMLVLVANSVLADAEADFYRDQALRETRNAVDEMRREARAADLQRQFDNINTYYDQREAELRQSNNDAAQRRAVNEILARERMEARDRGDYVSTGTYMDDLRCTGYSHDCD
jgi:multidrug efflux pump subunit AcrA (membrane-fusion protein)